MNLNLRDFHKHQLTLPSLISRQLCDGFRKESSFERSQEQNEKQYQFRVVCFAVLMIPFFSKVNAVKFPEEQRRIMDELSEQGPWIGLITVFSLEERAFFESGALKLNPKYPFIDVSGRRFRIGTVYDRKVIYVRCGMGMLNAGVVTQTLADLFNVVGIIHFGIAGNTNNSLSIADVTVPGSIAYTGFWEWLQSAESRENKNSMGTLVVGKYNIPRGTGQNLLGKISYKASEFYTKSRKPNEPQYILWVNTSSEWLHAAESLKGLELSSCANESTCLPRSAKTAMGLRAASADIMVNNAAYRDFLVRQFNVSSVDEESAAVVMTSLSNNLKVLVFRGLSDLAGAEEAEKSIAIFGGLAAANAVKAVTEFIKLLPMAEAPKISNL